jgi:hypothetical protein
MAFDGELCLWDVRIDSRGGILSAKTQSAPAI